MNLEDLTKPELMQKIVANLIRKEIYIGIAAVYDIIVDCG
jgi:hypothetical protein